MKLFKNAKSSIFQLVRNYILLEAYDGSSDDLGSLEIKWPLTASWTELITNAAKAFRYIYRVNYMLYRKGGPALVPQDYKGRG